MNYFKASVSLPRIGGGITETDPIIGYTFKAIVGGLRITLVTWNSEANAIAKDPSVSIVWEETDSFLLPKTAELRNSLNIDSNILGDFTPAIHLAMQYYLEEIGEIGEGNLTTWLPPA